MAVSRFSPRPLLRRLRARRLGSGLVRLGLAVVVLAVVLRFGGSEVWTKVAHPEVVPWLLLGAGVHLGQRAARMAKWSDMLRDIPVRRRDFQFLFRTQLVGMLANLVAPVSEALKIGALARDRSEAVVVSTTIVADVALHAAGMGVVGVLGALVLGIRHPLVGGGALAVSALATLILLGLQRWPRRARGRIRYARGRTLAWTTAEVALQVAVYLIAFRALRVDVGPGRVVAIAPLLFLGDAITVTPSGLGLREGLFAAIFEVLGGAPADTAIAVGLTISAMMFAAALAGGVPALLLRGPARDDATAAVAAVEDPAADGLTRTARRRPETEAPTEPP
ncbi:MAG: lysylphosphatidylglycerol synthase transmembrane domain-containing protein [Myxococcota bacterium]